MTAVAMSAAAIGAGVAATPAARPRWYAHGLNRPPAYRLIARLGGALPRRPRLAVAAALGGRLAACFGAEQAAVARAAELIVPAATARQRAVLVRQVFRHFAMCLVDLMTVNRGGRAERLLARVDGAAHLAAIGDRGAVMLTAHLGNWELGGRLLAGHLGRPTHVVVAPEADPAVERLLRDGPSPVRYVVRGEPTAPLPLLAALRRGDLVAMQGDRALGSRGDVAVEFFGVPAWFPLGPFLLARAAGVPVLPSFCLLDADRRYVVTVEPPIRVAEGGEHAALAAWVATLQARVARHPEQWFNFFDVWSPAAAR